ncbi:MAG: hypothetical protein ACRD22_13220 [Terriglobia bacterium]
MKKLVVSVFVLSLVAFWGSASTFAKKAQAENSSTSEPAAHAAKATTHHHARKAAAKSETISGTISMVDAANKIVVVTDSNGVPFDFKVTHRTRIDVNGNRASLSQLADQTNKQASVKFMDRMKAGQFAETIKVSD